MSAEVNNILNPEVGCKVYFKAAFAICEKITKKKKEPRMSSRHRGEAADLDNGWIIIDRQWYAKD